jgi:hypothetical protein
MAVVLPREEEFNYYFPAGPSYIILGLHLFLSAVAAAMSGDGKTKTKDYGKIYWS